ncbi:MAG: RidA family protein [Ancrocorticia sp.]|nr:RidA family protein [Ancrocorticia sp.]MCI1896060.1 RidA family protein [Ancrocorticia sp.]MCI1932690.1 RidA family protein [Ancrocorticia sp.]MCI1963778.1 RidA family protein [Ancrocorticia sp.]MCI2002116.1 RidA family protein [Ancrocorticia sp.]
MVSPSERLRELGISLPPVAKPVAAYVPAQRIGTSVRTSGQLPFVDGVLPVTGKVGAGVAPEVAYEQARVAALNAIAAAAGAAGGIDAIRRIAHVTVFVASSPDFTGQPQVANGASDVLQQVFGDDGVHTRSAVGVAVLPLDSPVEVEISCEAVGL